MCHRMDVESRGRFLSETGVRSELHRSLTMQSLPSLAGNAGGTQMRKQGYLYPAKLKTKTQSASIRTLC